MTRLLAAGVLSYLLMGFVALLPTASLAGNHNWQHSAMAQGYFLDYSGSSTRNAAFNIGVSFMSDYLETGSLSFGYNYTSVDIPQNTVINENMFHLGGRYSWFSDALAGKLSIGLDGFAGEYTSETTTIISDGGGMGGRGGTIRLTSSESTGIAVLHPQLMFMNFSRTFYGDLGYAYSEYDSDAPYDTEAEQITATLGFGWNEMYDWLQLRGYFINVEQETRFLNGDNFKSVEIKYIHWFSEKTAPYLNNVRITLLAGERVLAVDADAKAVYSISDKQTGGVSIAGQWKLSQSMELMLLAGYDQYEDDLLAENYDSLLIYGNIKSQW
ncbi:MAG: hypothetical protein L0Z73_10840 [Gammaproteobacteria bacterium]|nr:hypothetical protein [Gammaproteobacteria bacterium]